MKIYVVTDGDYSDYRIEGAFSTLKKAKEFTKYNDYTIETFNIDTPKSKWNIGFKFDMNKNGNTFNFETQGSINEDISNWAYYNITEHENEVFCEKCSSKFDVGNNVYDKDVIFCHKCNDLTTVSIKLKKEPEIVLHVSIKSDSKKRAVKVINELRSRIIAAEKWGDNKYLKTIGW